MNHEAMLGLLAADRPDPTHRDKLMLFGQFIGSWDLDIIIYPPDGTNRRLTGEWHFGWVLGGRAVQDVLITRPAADPDAAGHAGSTLRAYDPHMDAWWVVWLCPPDREFSTLFARQVGDRIVLEGQWTVGDDDRRGRGFEWSFSDIAEDRFHWQARITRDGGQTWRLVEEMHARRRPSHEKR